MIEILPESETDTLAVVISGELTHDDYHKVEPELSLRAEKEGTFDVLIELADIEGMEWDAVKEEFEFTREYSDNIVRMAIVSSDSWWRQMSKLLGKPAEELFDIEAKHFGDRVEAWKWLESEK